jgi:hypothetical protein
MPKKKQSDQNEAIKTTQDSNDLQQKQPKKKVVKDEDLDDVEPISREQAEEEIRAAVRRLRQAQQKK